MSYEIWMKEISFLNMFLASFESSAGNLYMNLQFPGSKTFVNILIVKFPKLKIWQECN